MKFNTLKIKILFFLILLSNTKVYSQTEISVNLLPMIEYEFPKLFQINQKIKNNWSLMFGFSFLKSDSDYGVSAISISQPNNEISFSKYSNQSEFKKDYSLSVGVRYQVYEKSKYKFFFTPLVLYNYYNTFKGDYIDLTRDNLNLYLSNSDYVKNMPREHFYELEDEVKVTKRGLGVEYTLQSEFYKNLFLAIDAQLNYSLINTVKSERQWHPARIPTKFWERREVDNNARGFEFTPLAKIRVGYIWK